MDKSLSISLEEHKKIMLNILKTFAEFCDNNQLTYFLDAGTLIGAVRHKGFIPWDDDVDVCMLRDDYNRFLDLMKTKGDKLSEYIVLEHPDRTMHPFLKIVDVRAVLVEYPDRYPIKCNVYIDVFAKDGIRDTSWKSRWLCKRSEIFGLIHWFNHFSIFVWKEKGNIFQKIIAFLGRLFFKNSNWAIRAQQRLMRRNAEKNPMEKCQYVTTLSNGEFHKMAPKECFFDSVLMPFENQQFRCPVGYDKYLHCLYKDDYMQLPPEEKRAHHNIIVYWKPEGGRQDFNRTNLNNDMSAMQEV